MISPIDSYADPGFELSELTPLAPHPALPGEREAGPAAAGESSGKPGGGSFAGSGADEVLISAEGRERARRERGRGEPELGSKAQGTSSHRAEHTGGLTGERGVDGKALDEEESKQVDELEQRDREVRQHEQAHLAAAGGQATGGARLEYEQGPDGKRYATGGEVSISFGGDTPEERLKQAQNAERAALAPAEPSPQDRQIAMKARRTANEAQRELNEQRGAQMRGESDEARAPGSAAPVTASASPLAGDPHSEAGPLAPGSAAPSREAPASPLEERRRTDPQARPLDKPGPAGQAADAYEQQRGPAAIHGGPGNTHRLEATVLPGALLNLSA